MRLPEKFTFAHIQKAPIYDAIPLVVIHKGEKRHFQVQREDLKYYVASPFWMKFRLLLFWVLWAALITAMITVVLTWFCFTPQLCYNAHVHRYIHEHVNE